MLNLNIFQGIECQKFTEIHLIEIIMKVRNNKDKYELNIENKRILLFYL